MKLKDWADKEGIAYITAYRWFKAGKLPVKAYQAESGTIIVEDDAFEMQEAVVSDNKLSESPVAQLIKKAVEISKAGDPVEDLATFIISNFKLEKFDTPELPRKARMKPTKEMTENHFKKFMKSDNRSKPEAKMFLVNESDLANVVAASENAEKGITINGNQTFGTVVSTNVEALAKANLESKSIVSDMNSAIKTGFVATPKTYANVDSSILNRTLVDGEGVVNSTLSAASTSSSVSNFNAQATYNDSNVFLNYYTDEHLEDNLSESLNEVSAYHPVTYDEARALLALNPENNDPLTLDRRAKQLCTLDRDSFDSIVKSIQNNRK